MDAKYITTASGEPIRSWVTMNKKIKNAKEVIFAVKLF